MTETTKSNVTQSVFRLLTRILNTPIQTVASQFGVSKEKVRSVEIGILKASLTTPVDYVTLSKQGIPKITGEKNSFGKFKGDLAQRVGNFILN